MLLPSDLVILKSKKEIAVTVLHELALYKIQVLDATDVF
jgi:hypothetical protein